jgi:excisionase family DNA binding protein
MPMMPHCKQETQFELFESAPKLEAAPRLALPFQRSQEIDVSRMCSILGVSQQTAVRMLRGGLVRAYKVGSWRIEYDSVVEYCERLRLEYRISERSAPRPAAGRMRDRDLLPFRLADTVYMQETMDLLSCSINAVIHLIEEGALTAYKVTLEGSGCRWRIYRPSLERYIAGLHAAAASPSLRRSTAAR